jgi:hypothetical protein
MKNQTPIPLLFLFSLVAGCADADVSALMGAGVKEAPPAAPPGEIAPSGGSVRAPYQVRTTAEIASALSACLGEGVTTVTEPMIQTQKNPAGFLSARQFKAGDDVVAGEATILDGDPSVARSGVRNATISLAVLSALQDIGNVAGARCAAAQDANPRCRCATREDAHALLGRCLPTIAPAAYAGLEEGFAATCTRSPAAAIASLVASTAFGVR